MDQDQAIAEMMKQAGMPPGMPMGVPAMGGNPLDVLNEIGTVMEQVSVMAHHAPQQTTALAQLVGGFDTEGTPQQGLIAAQNQILSEQTQVLVEMRDLLIAANEALQKFSGNPLKLLTGR